MSILISEINHGLQFLISDDLIKGLPIFFNKGDALNASADRYMSDDEDEFANVVRQSNDYSDLKAISDNLAKQPRDRKAKYAGMPIDVYDHELNSCDASKKEVVYCIRLDDEFHEPCSKSQCIEILKQANCDESRFFRCCKNDPWRFYAKLTDKQAEDVSDLIGMWYVSPYYDIMYWCLGSFTPAG